MCNIPGIGHVIKDREFTTADDDWKRAFVDVSLYFPADGRITQWKIHGRETSSVKLQVYRRISKGTDFLYMCISKIRFLETYRRFYTNDVPVGGGKSFVCRWKW